MQSLHIPADTKRSIKQPKLRDRAPACPVMPLTHANFINTTL